MKYEPPRLNVEDEGDEISRAEREASIAWFYRHQYKWAGLGICLFLGFLIVIGVIAFSWVGDTDRRIHSHEARLQQLNMRTSPFSSQSLYSYQANAKTETRSDFCHTALYYIHRLGNGSDALDTLQVASMERLDQLNAQRLYEIKTHVALRFAVDSYHLPNKASYSSGNTGDNDERYLVAQLTLATNYGAFSTIRLMEASYDAYRHTMKTTRGITLCSDDPNSSAKRCSGFITVDRMMLMNNTYTVPMDTPQRAKSNSSSMTGRGSAPGDDGASDVSVNDGTSVERNNMEESIVHEKLYYMLFYSEYRRSNADLSTSNNNNDDYGGDYQALGVLLRNCAPN